MLFASFLSQASLQNAAKTKLGKAERTSLFEATLERMNLSATEVGSHRSPFFAVLALWVTIFTSSVLADVTLPGFFSDHMVLQRGLPVPVWGQAAPGEKVIVKFREQEKTVTAGKDGRWKVALDPLTAGGPDKLIVSETNTVTFEDVLVGEVWLGSGQSNMAGWYARDDAVLDAAVNAAPHPRLRLSSIRRNGRWEEASVVSLN